MAELRLNLKRNLVFLDLETTGLNVIRDRIVQIALIRIHADGSPDAEFTSLVNPGIPISEESMRVHGITPKDLANKPSFAQLADAIFEFIGGADLGGYNSNRFDIPMLIEEFGRAGIDFDISKRHLIDVQRIFYKMEPRTLKAAYRLYCGGELEDAHDALADTRATIKVFRGQLSVYAGKDLVDEDGTVLAAPVCNDMAALHAFTNDLNFLDATQKLRVLSDGKIVFNFGKYQGQEVAAVLAKDKHYYHWIQEKEFSIQVKQIIRNMMNVR
jgi:DNA polymerase-3 subunit epsilon